MIKAIPINTKGEQVGEAKFFTPENWERLKRTIRTKAKFNWREVETKDNSSELMGTNHLANKDVVELLEPSKVEILTKKKRRKKNENN